MEASSTTSAVPRCLCRNDQRAFGVGGFSIKAGLATVRNPHTYLVGALALHRPAEHVTEISQSTAACRRPESSVICKSLMRFALAQYFFGGCALRSAPLQFLFFLHNLTLLLIIQRIFGEKCQ